MRINKWFFRTLFNSYHLQFRLFYTAIPITTPSPNTLPLNCTFEDTTACFLKDVVGSDDFDWTIRSVCIFMLLLGDQTLFENDALIFSGLI